MKKILVLLFCAFLVTGCVNIRKSSIDDIIVYALQNESIELSNNSTGAYKYYLPKGFNIIQDNQNNVVFQNEKYTMYLYVDFISYYNKTQDKYIVNDNAYYSKEIQNKDKYGYLEINLVDSKYLIEIMYNYAKIEVIVEKEDINVLVSYALAILSSISYNDAIILQRIGEDDIKYSEIEYNIFEANKGDDSLQNYTESSTTIVEDTDLIK